MSENIRHREDSIIALREQREKEAAIQSAALFVFRKLAEGGEVDDLTIAEHAPLFDVWNAEDIIPPGSIRRCPEDGRVYRALPLPTPMEPMAAAATDDTGDAPNKKKTTKPKPPSQSPEAWEQVAVGDGA